MLSSSYSAVSTYEQCPRRYWYQYLSPHEPLPDQEPTNALILGGALHMGLEEGPESALQWYRGQFFDYSDAHVNEEIKLEHYIKRGLEELPRGENEVTVETEGKYRGKIDLVTENEDGTVDIWDAKYANPKSADRYLESRQLPLYAYYYQIMTGRKVRSLRYAIFPKVAIRQKKTETLETFRMRLRETLQSKDVIQFEVLFDLGKVIEHWELYGQAVQDKEYAPNRGKLCDWCPFQQHCESGEDYMLLPSPERRTIAGASYKKVWVYGAPFTGKTTLANQFPTPLLLNTDGNYKFVDAAHLHIRNQVTKEGRITKTTSAWEYFKDVISELETDDNFETLVLDLVEDLHEYARQHVLDENGWTHEQDGGYGAGYKKVESEFLGTMKRLVNLDKNIVLISHENTSKDITKKTGDKLSSVRPNVPEKLANKLAGYVDVVARAVVDDDDHILSFKTDEVVFGGGRLKLKATEVPLSYSDLEGIYPTNESQTEESQEVEPEEATAEAKAEEPESEPEAEVKPGRRRRKAREDS